MAKHIVVVGAGAVGACTAYFLAQKATPGLTVTVVEKTKVACAASGKAGGFLARDWCDGSAIGPIARKSFALHAELADKLDGKSKYGYRPVDTYSVFVQTGKKAGQRKPAAVESSTIEWVDNENIKAIQQLGTTSDTAQVHPGQFTNTVLGAAVDTGIVRVQCGTGVSGLLYSEEDGQTVVGVKLENGDTIQADAVIVCMGPWSGQLELKGSSRRVNALPIEGSRAHSIVCRPKLTVPAQALFTEIIEGRRSYSPEVYPRPDGTVYMCGATDDEPLPSSADQIKIDQEAIDQLKALKDVVSPQLEGEITAEQACYLPISRDGTPLIGMHPKYKQLYVATGHSCWGILNSPATGLMMAELVLNGEVDSIDERAVRSVDPRNRC